MYRSREIGWRGFQIASSPPRSGQRQKEEESNSERTKEETHTQIAHFVGQIVIRRFIFFVSFLFHSVGRKISFYFFLFLRSSLFFWHARPHRLFSKALTRHLNKKFLSFLFLVTLKLFLFYFWMLPISNSQCFRPTVALAVNCWQVPQSFKRFFLIFKSTRARATRNGTSSGMHQQFRPCSQIHPPLQILPPPKYKRKKKITKSKSYFFF